MATTRTLLHGTDFSPCSRRAYDVACALARDAQARLIVAHVGAVPASSFGGTQGVPPLPEEYGREELEVKLRELPAPAGIDIERKLVFGDPVEELLRLARDRDCAMIILGTHGRSGLFRLLAGSVAEHVLRNAACPVLTVRDQPK